MPFKVNYCTFSITRKIRLYCCSCHLKKLIFHFPEKTFGDDREKPNALLWGTKERKDTKSNEVKEFLPHLLAHFLHVKIPKHFLFVTLGR